MSFVEGLYRENFIEYASYVIKERAIPHIDDGLKPVQRRILHSLLELDDGKYHKVANVVGHSMKYHPHGDASIYSALVVIANKNLFIDKQGNFGNTSTGDPAAAGRYIECRVSAMAKEVLYNPHLTNYTDSYDNRNREPVTFPAKIPVLLASGTEGIAVGMATKVLPHNLVELLQAQIACLKGESFTVYPDFESRGLIDISQYNDGNGKVRVRALLDTKDPKKIVVREIPYGTTTESLIASIESAARKNRVKISSISDFTSEEVEIEILLPRGVYAKDVIESLYAFTDCDISISPNLVVIKNEKPCVTNVTSVIKHNTDRLMEILEQELLLEQTQLLDKLHGKTLEQIFIENRVYKTIESMTTQAKVMRAVVDGLEPYQNRIKRDVTDEDVDKLLKIPIRRISLYDINKAKREMTEIKKRLKEIKGSLCEMIKYGIDFIEGLIKRYGDQFKRRSKIVSFETVNARQVAKKDLKLRYDKATGYLGTGVNGDLILEASLYDRVLVIRSDGRYSVMDIPEKVFVDKKMCFCGFVNKEREYNFLYKDEKNGYAYIKRCLIDRFRLNTEYTVLPEGASLKGFSLGSSGKVELKYKPKPRSKVVDQSFSISEFSLRGIKANGVRLAPREIKSARLS